MALARGSSMMKWFVSDQPTSKSNYKTGKNAPLTPLEMAVRGQREASPQVKRSTERSSSSPRLSLWSKQTTRHQLADVVQRARLSKQLSELASLVMWELAPSDPCVIKTQKQSAALMDTIQFIKAYVALHCSSCQP